jgi:hypothetical protein
VPGATECLGIAILHRAAVAEDVAKGRLLVLMQDSFEGNMA